MMVEKWPLEVWASVSPLNQTVNIQSMSLQGVSSENLSF